MNCDHATVAGRQRTAGGSGREMRRELHCALLPPLTILLAVITAGALLLAAAVLVPPPLPAASALVRPVEVLAAPGAAVTNTTLGQSVRVELPRTPAVVDLARLIYPPGAEGSHHALPGPLLMVVEAGALTVQLGGAAQLLQGQQAQPVAAGQLILHPGDGLMLPRTTPAAFRNRGTTPAVALAAGVFPAPAAQSGLGLGRIGPARWAESWAPGATVQPLAGGWLVDPAAEAAALTVQRLSLPPGAGRPLTALGPVDLAVETGALTLVIEGGLVWQQPLEGPDQFIAAASDATLLPGDAALLQRGAEVTLRNDGRGPLVVLALAVEFNRDDLAATHRPPHGGATPAPRAVGPVASPSPSLPGALLFLRGTAIQLHAPQAAALLRPPADVPARYRLAGPAATPVASSARCPPLTHRRSRPGTTKILGCT